MTHWACVCSGAEFSWKHSANSYTLPPLPQLFSQPFSVVSPRVQSTVKHLGVENYALKCRKSPQRRKMCKSTYASFQVRLLRGMEAFYIVFVVINLYRHLHVFGNAAHKYSQTQGKQRKKEVKVSANFYYTNYHKCCVRQVRFWYWFMPGKSPSWHTFP